MELQLKYVMITKTYKLEKSVLVNSIENLFFTPVNHLCSSVVFKQSIYDESSLLMSFSPSDLSEKIFQMERILVFEQTFKTAVLQVGLDFYPGSVTFSEKYS